MTYKEAISESMNELSKKNEVVFLGQGLIVGDRIYGTMDGVPTNKCSEMPCAENLTMGVAIGLALRGFRPVVIFQRMDFILLAADAIINHAALMPKMSGGQFKLPILIRAIVGSQSKSFDVGPQHQKDFSELFAPYLSLNRFNNTTTKFGANAIQKTYEHEYSEGGLSMLVEYKDLYATECIQESPKKAAKVADPQV